MYPFNPSLYWLWLLLPAFVTPTNPAYRRILNLNYAVRGTDNFGYSDMRLFNLIDQVQPALTSVVPFFLNVDDISSYQTKLAQFKKRGIVLVPAVGFPNEANMNSATNQKIARVYSGFTDSIRLEIYKDYEANATTLQNVQDFITFLTNQLNFAHIILNAWPKASPTSDSVYPFKSSALDGSQEQNEASYNCNAQNTQCTTDESNPMNWYPPGARTERVTDYMPSADILCNYEAPGEELALANHPVAYQENAMQTTITQINKRPAADHLHWMAPFSTSYNPVQEGTYDFIVQKLSAM